MKLLVLSTQSLATSTEGLFPETQNLVFHKALTRTEEGVQDSYRCVGCAMNFTESSAGVVDSPRKLWRSFSQQEPGL